MLLTTALHRAGYVLFFRSRRNTRSRSGVERSYSRGFLRVRGCFGISQDHARVSGCCIKHPRQRSLLYIATCCLADVGLLPKGFCFGRFSSGDVPYRYLANLQQQGMGMELSGWILLGSCMLFILFGIVRFQGHPPAEGESNVSSRTVTNRSSSF